MKSGCPYPFKSLKYCRQRSTDNVEQRQMAERRQYKRKHGEETVKNSKCERKKQLKSPKCYRQSTTDTLEQRQLAREQMIKENAEGKR